MTTYQGFDVLELEPNWGPQGRKEALHRSIVKLDSRLGKLQVDAKSSQGRLSHEYNWFMPNRTEVDIFKTFLAARKGAAVPFWMPTWQRDLVLALDTNATDAGITIKYSGFTKYVYPALARHYIAMIATDGSGNKSYLHANGANDPGTGQETISFDTQLGYAFKAATTMICFLPLWRLTNDRAQIHWHNSTVGECTLNLLEIPREVP